MATTLAAAEAALKAKIAAVIAANPGFPALEFNDPHESEDASGERIVLASGRVVPGEMLLGATPLWELAAHYVLAVAVREDANAARDARVAAIRDAISAALEADFQLGGAVDECELDGFDAYFEIPAEGGAAHRDDSLAITLHFIGAPRTGAAGA